jgi:hypothetical protein
MGSVGEYVSSLSVELPMENESRRESKIAPDNSAADFKRPSY